MLVFSVLFIIVLSVLLYITWYLVCGTCSPFILLALSALSVLNGLGFVLWVVLASRSEHSCRNRFSSVNVLTKSVLVALYAHGSLSAFDVASAVGALLSVLVRAPARYVLLLLLMFLVLC